MMASDSDSSSAAAEKMKDSFVVEDEHVFKEEIHLTVLKTSLFFAGDGFTVYDCKGELVFRVDSYGPDSSDTHELVLMDPNGRCLLTVRRKVRTHNHHYLVIYISSESSNRIQPWKLLSKFKVFFINYITLLFFYSVYISNPFK